METPSLRDYILGFARELQLRVNQLKEYAAIPDNAELQRTVVTKDATLFAGYLQHLNSLKDNGD